MVPHCLQRYGDCVPDVVSANLCYNDRTIDHYGVMGEVVNYTITSRYDADGCFSVSRLDYPCCHPKEKTEEETSVNITVAIWG